MTRENAIKQLKRMLIYMEHADDVNAIKFAIKELPSVQPKERTGEWQQDMDGTYLCSECGSGFKEQPTLMGKPMFAYCPICGVRMQKGGEE